MTKKYSGVFVTETELQELLDAVQNDKMNTTISFPRLGQVIIEEPQTAPYKLQELAQKHGLPDLPNGGIYGITDKEFTYLE